MSTSARTSEIRATDVRIGRRHLEVSLVDGRPVRVPFAWFPRLQAATPEQRRQWHLIGKGIGIRWEEIDEDVSVANLLRA